VELEDVVKGEICISNGIVTVIGSVNMSGRELTEIPWEFGSVTGDFDCSNNRITSLRNSPSDIGGNFNCSSNLLKTLEFSPRFVKGDVYLGRNKFESLRGMSLFVTENVAGTGGGFKDIKVPDELVMIIEKLMLSVPRKRLNSIKERLRRVVEEE